MDLSMLISNITKRSLNQFIKNEFDIIDNERQIKQLTDKLNYMYSYKRKTRRVLNKIEKLRHQILALHLKNQYLNPFNY